MPLFSSLLPLILLSAFSAGLVIGSFLNVVILRGQKKEYLGGRSHCDACGRTLRAHELIPIVSFVLQQARCRSCGAVLSWQYPLVEAFTALSFVLIAWRLVPAVSAGALPAFLFVLAFPAAAALIVLLISDFRFQTLPDGATLVLAICGAAASLVRGAFAADIAAGLAIGLFFAALWFFSRGRWMGFGDAKLIFATSLGVGFPASIPAFLFAFWLGGIVSIMLLALGKKGMQSRIPFGPFIVLGAILAYFLAPWFLALTGLAMIL